MAQFNDNIITIKGIGEKKAHAFGRLGIKTLYDLISFFPRKYEDRTKYKSIALIEDGESACISAVVATTPTLSHIRRGMDLVKFKITDGTTLCDVTYFNQSWIKNNIECGQEYIFFGKMEKKGSHCSLVNPVYELETSENRVTGKIIPIYSLTSGVSQKDVSQSVRYALDSCEEYISDIIPEEVLSRQKLARAKYSFENIHFPSDFKALEIARRRLIFEELFTLACALGKMRGERTAAEGIKIKDISLDEFYKCLPFSLTNAQIKAIDEAANDMSSGYMMNRLIQGDVGSGKTVVAAALIYLTYKAGYMSAFMAPTEILAEQHFQTLTKMLSPLGLSISKLTGSMSAKEKSNVKKALLNGDIDLIIGTHALFTDDVEYKNLGLVVTDEQHRFGVSQRAAIIEKGEKPHVLVMSATPIPRTLALIIYGDLDVSVIDELPPGRQTVDTFAVNESYRERLNGFIKKQCDASNQVFVVCPMVEENEENNLNLKSAEQHTQELRSALPSLTIECVHGKMKPKEKDEIMSRFSRGEIDVLVSTTVIEVGVDVPNATLMIIENAERFGLSQLHQLRGRVGRGQSKSYCILVSDSSTSDIKARLDVLCSTNDGFKISEEDLRLRGPGDFFGSRQHGLPEMHVADLGVNTDTLKIAQEEANLVLGKDPELSSSENALLKQRIDAMFSSNFDRFN